MTETEKTLRELLALIAEKKGEEPVVLDMREFSIPTDFFVITHGDNPKHVKAIAENILEGSRRAGVDPWIPEWGKPTARKVRYLSLNP
jgi:ribosomal silencing factor RsfS